MPESNREAPIPPQSSRRPRILDRIQARHRPQPESAAIFTRNQQEKLRILEEAAQKATGTNLRELRASFAGNRKQTPEALAALRARPTAQRPAAAAPANRLFQSLQPLAGRLVPLAQPSFAFLNAPYAFETVEEGGPWIWNSSIAPGNAFFQTDIHASSASDLAVYTFKYLWTNDSDAAMIATVFAALSFTGWLSATAQQGRAESCWDATVDAYLDIELALEVPGSDSGESRTDTITYLRADNGFWGVGSGLAEQLYNNQDYGISLDGYLVPANSSLEIDVSAAFSFWWGFDTPVIPSENNAEADFGERQFTENRVVSNGVVVFASPVTIQ